MAQHKPARPPSRVVSRLSVDFLLRSVRAITRLVDGDILGGIAILALLQGCYAQNAVAGTENALRVKGARPVSVLSLARSLKVPAETMRRCVGRLIDQGWLVRDGRRGVVISDDIAGRRKIARLMGELRASLRDMLSALVRIGFDFDVMDQAVPETRGLGASTPEAAPLSGYNAGVDRAILDFGLRVAEAGLIPLRNNYVLSCVMGAIVSANTSPFAYDPAAAWHYGTNDTPPPDAIRRAVTMTEVSEILGLPYETTRRYVSTLETYKLCVRDERKMLMVPTHLLQVAEAETMRAEFARRFVSLIGELKRQGYDFAAVEAAGRIV